MDRMNVTVTSDASFYYVDKVGGYAYQIKSNDGLIRKWGPLDGKLKNPTVAELRSLWNALNRLTQEDYKIGILTINVDCEFIVKHMFTKKEGRSPAVVKMVDEISELLDKLDYDSLNIKHVKAHSEIINPRRFVNDWCDRHSRQGSIIASCILHGKPVPEQVRHLVN